MYKKLFILGGCLLFKTLSAMQKQSYPPVDSYQGTPITPQTVVKLADQLPSLVEKRARTFIGTHKELFTSLLALPEVTTKHEDFSALREKILKHLLLFQLLIKVSITMCLPVHILIIG